MSAYHRFGPAVCLVLLCAFALNAAAAEAPAKPRAPSWKYRTNHMQVDVARDGSSTVKYELAYTVLAESALHSVSEQDISYHEHDGTLEDVVAYTLKKDGRRIDVPETNVQVTSHNGINGAAPAFSDYMSRHLVFADVEVGDSVVLSYTLRNLKPSFKGYYSLLTFFSDTHAYDDAVISVTAPTSLGLKHKTYNLAAPKVVRQGKDTQQWTWTYRNPTPRDTRQETTAYERAWHYREMPTIELSNFRDYRQIATAYESQAAPHAQVNERVRTQAAQIVGDATDRREQAARIYRWVSKEISFAGNCLTGGDVVPRDTDLVLNMKMGDCKDHSTLIQALLAARGINSSQVLVNAREMGYELPEQPCWQAFNHVMNYLPEFDLYLDATSSFNPFGTLPSQDRGKLVIHTGNYNGIKRTPSPDAKSNYTDSMDTVKVLADGSMQVTGKYTLGGDLANVMSKQFHDWQQTPDFDGGVESIHRAIEGLGYEGGGSYSGFPEGDGPAATFGYTVEYHVREFYDTGDPHGVQLTAFFPTPNPISGLVQFAAVDHYDHDFFCSGDTRHERLTMTFPDNVRLLGVPKDAHAKTALIDFDATYTLNGNTITVERSVAERTQGPICAPEMAAQYARIAAAIKKDQKTQAVYVPK